MDLFLLFASIILIICIISNKFSNKIGVPVLSLFILFGMLVGSDGLLKLHLSNSF